MIFKEKHTVMPGYTTVFFHVQLDDLVVFQLKRIQTVSLAT